jgi:hypothetical protein
MTDFTVHPIDTDRLAAIRAAGRDEGGNPLAGFAAAGWEPLRCCLRLASPEEQVALISYRPFVEASVWAETGPVFIHLDACGGYAGDAGLPASLRTGPRVLRPYDAAGALAYDHIELVPDGVDIEPALRKILGEPSVELVHVRAALAQCFTYAVTR